MLLTHLHATSTFWTNPACPVNTAARVAVYMAFTIILVYFSYLDTTLDICADREGLKITAPNTLSATADLSTIYRSASSQHSDITRSEKSNHLFNATSPVSSKLLTRLIRYEHRRHASLRMRKGLLHAY